LLTVFGSAAQRNIWHLPTEATPIGCISFSRAAKIWEFAKGIAIDRIFPAEQRKLWNLQTKVPPVDCILSCRAAQPRSENFTKPTQTICVLFSRAAKILK
jgi:hypothetical protein